MTNSTTSNQDNGKAAKKKQPFTMALRISTILVLIWLGITTGGALQSLLLGPKTEASTTPSQAKLPEMPNLTLEMLRGRWEFAGMPISVEMQQTEEDHLDAVLAQRPKKDDPPISLGDNRPEMWQMMQSRLQVIGNEQGVVIHGTDEPALRLRLFARDDETAGGVLGGNIAVPRAGGQWMVVSLRGCRPETAGKMGGESFLELPAGTRRVASRRGHDGRLQCEIVDLSADFAAVAELWKQSGWVITESPLGPAESQTFFMTRGSEMVQVYILAAAGTPVTNLLLVRSPATN